MESVRESPGLDAPGRAECAPAAARERPDPIWSCLSDSETTLLKSARTGRPYARGQFIYHQGDSAHGLFILDSGVVASRKTNRGGESLLLRMTFPGQVFGHHELFTRSGRTSSAEALTPCKVWLVPASLLAVLLRANARLVCALLASLSRELDAVEDSLLQKSVAPVQERLIRALLSLSLTIGRQRQDGSVAFRLPMKRKDFASLIGSRPETLARALRALEIHQGVLSQRNAEFLVDVRRLVQMADSPPPHLLS
jgi:CRP-like cAMP-binding protein